MKLYRCCMESHMSVIDLSSYSASCCCANCIQYKLMRGIPGHAVHPWRRRRSNLPTPCPQQSSLLPASQRGSLSMCPWPVEAGSDDSSSHLASRTYPDAMRIQAVYSGISLRHKALKYCEVCCHYTLRKARAQLVTVTLALQLDQSKNDPSKSTSRSEGQC